MCDWRATHRNQWYEDKKMNEKDFKILTTLNETRSITSASEKLYLTQSALSKRIKAIETELEVSLIIRSRQGISFTPEGEIVLDNINKVIETLKIMRKEICNSKEYITGTINIGVALSYARYFLSELINNFHKKFPHIKFKIYTGQSGYIYEKFRSHEIDLAIVRGNYPWDEKTIKLCSEAICIIKSKEDENKSLNEIPFIRRKTDKELEEQIKQWLDENDIEYVDSFIYVDDIKTCVEMVSKGLGWSIVPEISLKDFNGNISKMLYNNKPLERPTYVHYSTSYSDKPQVSAIVDFLKNEISVGV